MSKAVRQENEAPAPDPGELPRLGSDLLRGADQIADFMFDTPTERRKIYHLADTKKLPVFRLGALLCARKSTILTWIEAQESAATSAARPNKA